MDYDQPIRIGRINRAVEKALSISLPSDVNIDITGETLSGLARKHPESYLKEIEEAGNIIKSPNYVRFDEEKETFLFLKEYLKDGEFRKVGVEVIHEGTPKKWIFSSMRGYRPEELKLLDRANGFRKVF